MAELKRYLVAATRLQLECLHGIYAVAELKRRPISGTSLPSPRSPRHLCRGRIEALPQAERVLPSTRRLHGIYAVAELKRCDKSPVPQKLWGLHGIYAVAELKRCDKSPVPQKLWGLHGIYAVAELKLPCVAIEAAGIQSPRHLCRGRIEARR